jgi:hypothetical protein
VGPGGIGIRPMIHGLRTRATADRIFTSLLSRKIAPIIFELAGWSGAGCMPAAPTVYSEKVGW